MARFRVKELAKERGLTTEELAIKSGVKMSTVRNLWQGRTSDPNYSTLKALATALGVSVEDLEAEETQKNRTARLIAQPVATGL